MNRTDRGEMSGLRIYLRLLGYVRPHWRKLVVALVAMAVTAATEPGFAALMKPMIDGTFIERDAALIRLIPFAIFGVFLVRGISSFGSEYLMSAISRNLVMEVRRQAFERLLQLPVGFYAANQGGRLLAKLTYDVEQIARASTTAATILVRDSLAVVGLIGYMAWLSGWLVLIFLVVGPLLMLSVTQVTKRFRKLSRRIQRSVGEVASIAEEAIDGHQVVKIFGAQEYERRRFAEANRRIERNSLKYAATRAANGPVVQLIASIALAVIVYLATLEQVVASITAGTFMSFITALLLLLPPLKRLTEVNSLIQRGITAGESLFGLIDEPEEVDEGRREIDRARGAIEFRGVSFAYPGGRQVLKGIDLTVAPGETVALVGRSGSGKTTLVNLLPRFYDVDSGEILLDGVPLGEYRLAALRRQIAIVSQHVVLFDATVAENIAYGMGEVDPKALAEAARAAHALEFIERLPEGMDTRIGENGVMLSGGQRQRLAIARALLKDAPILILDEATSALDTESERQIQAALETLMRGRTTLVIAHRLSTIESADRIVVLEEGRIIEQGRHAELLARNGQYAALHRLQFGDSQPA